MNSLQLHYKAGITLNHTKLTNLTDHREITAGRKPALKFGVVED
jgi:hypothetical protein